MMELPIEHPVHAHRVALVTGGSGAIGGAVAEKLASRGVSVMLGYHANRDKAMELAERLRSRYSVEISPLHLDVRDGSSIRAAVAEVIAQAQRLDILVHAAGITRDKLLMQTAESDFDACIDSNVTSAFRLLQAVVPTMREQRYGRIVMLTSYAAIHGRAGQSAYAASKAALIGLTKAAALEEIAHGITINAVAPSVTQSAMTDALTMGEQARLMSRIPLGRMQTADEAAGLIDWLTSEQAATVSGQVLMTDTRQYGW
jgi:3-oxoacyl-[acyl-carrier protein] reductase